MEWKSPTITKPLGGSGRGEEDLLLLYLDQEFYQEIHANTAANRLMDSRFISLGGSLQDSTSTFWRQTFDSFASNIENL